MLKIPIEIKKIDENEIKEELNNFLTNFFKENGVFFQIQQQFVNAFNQ